MLNSESTGHRRADLGAVRIAGADAVKFLQGQLSNDISQLPAATTMLAGLHNAQGRVVALLRLFWVAPDEVIAVLPRELAASVAARLSKFLLRAKVKISDVSDEWDVPGLLNQQRIEVEHALNIANGIPQVYAATSEQFVAQMLNLDVLDAISFTKGCYTGQEVIARAHYRGRVKRRMQRFRTVAAAALAPNDTGQLKDGRSFRVVDAVTLPDGRAEFLAVTTMTQSQGDDEDASAQPSASSVGATSIDAEALPLPYELPV